MEISVTIICVVVVFLCFCSFALGLGAAFFFMARDKSLVRVSDEQVVVERAVLDQMVVSMQANKRNTRFDEKITDMGDSGDE